MEPIEILTWASMVFGATVVISLALPFILRPLAEHRREGHEQRMAEYDAAERAARASSKQREASGA